MVHCISELDAFSLQSPPALSRRALAPFAYANHVRSCYILLCRSLSTSSSMQHSLTLKCCFQLPHIKCQKKRRAATARRQHLKSAMLQLAVTEIEKEAAAKEVEKQNYLAEHCPPLSLPGSMQELQDLCRKLHGKIESVDEERYDIEVKLQKTNKELEDLSLKLFDLKGKFKRPPLRRVRMSADAMLRALLGSKHKVCMDLRANLKQVKKEDTEKEKDLRDVGDWRKNIEEKSGMEGRKKMFEAGES
ncbi:troponin I, fast skeletal muscle isoform X1 [Lathamus discolor]|uniref:troponin I, fast skeletal muscle isoform X1 n=2 Tax=Lathamus discolor TaxID=678569 RepID=UPI0032B811DF